MKQPHSPLAIIALSLLLVLLPSCFNTPTNPYAETNVSGFVQAEDGQPIYGIHLIQGYIEGKDSFKINEHYQTYSDSLGRFSLKMDAAEDSICLVARDVDLEANGYYVDTYITFPSSKNDIKNIRIKMDKVK